MKPLKEEEGELRGSEVRGLQLPEVKKCCTKNAANLWCPCWVVLILTTNLASFSNANTVIYIYTRYALEYKFKQGFIRLMRWWRKGGGVPCTSLVIAFYNRTAKVDFIHVVTVTWWLIHSQISLLQPSTHGINPNLCARSPPPPPLLTSCTELKPLHEKSCSQPHRCEYLYARCQDCGVCKEGGRESEREEERWREYSWIWIQLENYQARTARTERKAHRRRVTNISPGPRPPAIGSSREWSSPPPESTSLRWRASKRSASAR